MMFRRDARRLGYAVGMMGLLWGCNGNALVDSIPERQSARETFWQLTARYRAINLSVAPPFNVVQLEATARNAYGELIPTDGSSVEYLVVDTTRLAIDSGSILRAKAATTSAFVIARQQIGDVTKVDTITVKITATAPADPLDTFSIQPADGDSAIWSSGSETKTLRPVTKSQTGRTVSSLQVDWISKDPRIATISKSGSTNATLRGVAIGRVWVVGSTYTYGVERRDSVEFLIGFPAAVTVSVERLRNSIGQDSIAYYPTNTTIGVGGTVQWEYPPDVTGKITGITFEKPESAKGVAEYLAWWPLMDGHDGHAPPRELLKQPSGAYYGAGTIRTWTEPGVYRYWDDQKKTSATIVVRAKPEF